MSEVKILLCDDDPDLQGLLVRRLKKMGIEPDAAGDGRVAKGFVDDNDYDVIVTDIYMPEATGLEVMEYAKQKDPDTQVVIITSSATLDNAVDALNHGAFGYLTKPFDHLIVFDNMVSRALEYRQLVVADQRRAEAQKRRGDMLEDEVAQRVQQLQKTQKGLLDLLGSLPDGVLVVEEGGKVVLSSPVGERWLSQDKKTEEQAINVFVGQIHAESPETYTDVTIDGVDLHLMSANFPNDGEAKRKAVIIREVEDDAAGAGSMVTDTVMGIKKGLATLYEQGMGTEVVLNVASQFAVLEQLQGWSTGTGELNPEQAPAEAPGDTQASDSSIATEPAEVPSPTPAPEPASEPAPVEEIPAAQAPAPIEATPGVQAPSSIEATPEVPAPATAEETPAGKVQAAPEVGAVDATATIPPFTLPRERTPTGELNEPRMNTSELQDMLAATAPGDEPAAADPPVEVLAPKSPAPEATQEPPPAEVPAAEIPAPVQESAAAEIPAAEAPPPPDPMNETLVSASSREAEATAEVIAPPQDAVPIEAPAEVAIPQAEVPIEPPIQEGATDPSEAADDAIENSVEETSPPFHVDEPSAELETSVPEAGLDIPTSPTSSAAAVEGPPAADTPELEVEDQDDSFPRAESGTGDVPSWINGIQGITDPDLLADFEFGRNEPEPTFPKDQTGNLEDDSMYKPRVIPEAMNAKLNTPTELPKTNGDQEPAPTKLDGPITISAAQADTQMFRNVLKGLSGSEVVSGDYEKPPEEPPAKNGDAVARAEDGLDELVAAEDGLDELVAAEEGMNELRSAVRESPESEAPIETPQAEAPLPTPEELRHVQEPEPAPEPVHAEPASWPPVLPTKDDDWDDNLDVSG